MAASICIVVRQAVIGRSCASLFAGKMPSVVLKHVKNPTPQSKRRFSHRVFHRQNESTRKNSTRSYQSEILLRPIIPSKLQKSVNMASSTCKVGLFSFFSFRGVATVFGQGTNPPAPLACFMFDGRGLRPANGSPVPIDRRHLQKQKPRLPPPVVCSPTPS